MKIRVAAVMVVIGSTVALAQSLPLAAPVATEADGVYLIRYIGNFQAGDSIVNVTNAGTLNGADPAGRICVNVYTFDPQEELVSCCACLVTPNGLSSFSARNTFLCSGLTPGCPTSLTVKLIASLPLPGAQVCNPSLPTAATLV